MSIENDILQQLELTREEIQNNLEAKGINASGRTSASIHTKTEDGRLMLVMGGKKTAPAETLEIGRAGGNVPRGFYYIIKQWTRDKGLQFSTESERGTFSYFLARRIADEGTLRNKQHEDVYSTATQKAATTIKEMCQQQLKGSILEMFNKVNVSTIKSNF